MPDPSSRSRARKHRKFMLASILSGVLAVVGGIGIWFYWPPALSSSAPINPAQIAMGRVVYQQICASCHGVNLEGQPDWKDLNPNGKLPAPPHDVTGHTWHHADSVLLQIIEEGTAAFIGDGYESDMPGFGEVLSDQEIKAVLEFIKSNWSEREREYQEQFNQREREAEK